MAGDSEPFPPLTSAADHQFCSSSSDINGARRRRKSSHLGSELRVGDTGAPSLGTGIAHLNGSLKESPSPSPPPKRFSKRRKARSALRRAKSIIVKHTWVLPLVILLVFLSLYAINPTEANPIHHFIFLSYRLPVTDPDELPQYGKGPWDIAFVTFYTVVLSFTREFIMQEILRPMARWAGLKSRGKQARYMEQMYTALYFGVLGPTGMYVMSRTPVWYFNTRGMYENFPHKTHDALFKFYYLFQAAYWAQQAIVLLLGMEKPRKDFKELVGHHIVSLALIALSYRFHFTYMGLAVYITHDISDFFLATSKTLNYLDHWLTGPYYFTFMCVWIYLRHYLNLRILFSLFTEYKTVGPYELNWETQQYKCALSFVITLALLSSLQALNLFWLFFIIRIAYRFVVHNVAKDDRSDAEESEFEDVKQAAAVNGAANGKAKSYAAVAATSNGTANGTAKKSR
ncbi:longevity assurance proteins LAG1/LAC1 [Parathielavia appendiculata]|uniref:Longevity assurance proteins LAG1/LAC1 n=1 Tax=Parathielavia appendiculata TaxID=2587402 RepID=A0AAN6U060_9PEZI|nr:longevity assurance proteins LAG1/LAC1 [Parathielavia appendiculata]